MENENGSEKPSNVIPFDLATNWKTSNNGSGDGDGGDGGTVDKGSGNAASNPYGWMLDDKGKPINNVSNVHASLRNDPELKDSIILDEMLQTVCVTKPLPGSDVDPSTFVPRPVTDHDVTCIQEHLQRVGLRRVGRDLVHQGVDAHAQDNRHHPVREDLLSLKWDGKKRVAMWLTMYLGAESTVYHSKIGEMALLAMVARVMQPGCKVDHMLVLEGKQGIGKSFVCKILGGRYFSDSMPDVTKGKDALVHMAGKWIFEVPEMSAMSNAETNKLKAFLSVTEDQYRPPYARKEIKQPRQGVFIGTTNQTIYLKDDTGGRRFWPVRVGKIDLKALQADRDQLFAEAMVLFVTGQNWHPTAEFEKQYIMPEQEARFEADPWESVISAYLQENKPKRVYLGELFEKALHLESRTRERNKQNRIVAILHRLGWDRLPKDSNGNIPWGPLS